MRYAHRLGGAYGSATPVGSPADSRFQHRCRKLPCRRRTDIRYPQRENGGACRRVRLGQVGDRAGHPPDPVEQGPDRERIDPLQRSVERKDRRHRVPGAGERRHARSSGRAHRHDLPGADDLAVAAPHHRRPDFRSADDPRRRGSGQGEPAHHGSARAGRLPRSRSEPSRPIRSSSPAACASAP